MARLSQMPSQSAAARKRRQRERLQAAGLVSVQIWVPRESRTLVRRIEALLRLGAELTVPFLHKITPKGELPMDLTLLCETMDGYTSENGYTFQCRRTDDGEGLLVVVEDREEFPILVTADSEQVLCVTHLWTEEQILAETRTELLQSLLEMNVSLPLSSFGRVGNRYVLFGALAPGAQTSDLVTEFEALSENTLEAVEAVSAYLV